MSYTRFDGKLDASGLKIGIVASRFNHFLTEKLLDGAIDCIVRHNGDEKNVDVAWVPGSFEIPYAASRLVNKGGYDAIVCLGAVIRGDTPHFEYIAAEAAKGIARLSLDSGIPVLFGVITTDTLEQAIERAGTKAGNKGWDAAASAIEMVNLYKVIG